MRLLLLSFLFITGCAALPQKGTVQCPLGLQLIGCEFSALQSGPAAGTLLATCDVPKGKLVFPANNCVLINPRE